MKEKIAKIFVLNSRREDLINIINVSGGVMNKAKFLNNFMEVTNSLNSTFGKQDYVINNNEYDASTTKGLSLLCNLLDAEEDFSINEFDKYTIISSEWFSYGDILEHAVELLGKTKYDYFAIGTDGWTVFMVAFYEKGELLAKLVVGSFEDVYNKYDNLNLNAFDKMFNVASGTFKRLSFEKNISKVRQKFEKLTSIELSL